MVDSVKGGRERKDEILFVIPIIAFMRWLLIYNKAVSENGIYIIILCEKIKGLFSTASG